MTEVEKSCQILTVSSSLSQATALVHRVVQLSNAPSISSSQENPPASSSSSSSTSSVHIPWTISNRYYSADVHFSVHPINRFSPHLAGVPAAIFVWAEGDAYKHHIQRLAKDFEGSEPEVLLAVRTRADADPIDPADEIEDNSDIDGFLSAYGFEYIDATRDLPPRSAVTSAAPARQDDEDGVSDGIPHLPRILDALSTIMWPSMVRAGIGAGSSRPAFDEWLNQDSATLMLNGLLAEADTNFDEPEDRESGVRGNREEESMGSEILENPWTASAGDSLDFISPGGTQWFAQSDTDDEDIWKSAAVSTIISSPTEFDATSPFGTSGASAARIGGDPSLLGFEDDFSSFVSASSSSRDRSSTPGSDASGHTFVPEHAYLPLESSSYFGDGGPDDAKNHFAADDDDDNGDDGLPTKEEIQEMSARIFASASLDEDTDGTAPGPLTADTLTDLINPGDSTFDMAHFDIEKVLGALQHMKAEIASMENEDDRRKAAAKVALGLVYGLEADAESSS